MAEKRKKCPLLVDVCHSLKLPFALSWHHDFEEQQVNVDRIDWTNGLHPTPSQQQMGHKWGGVGEREGPWGTLCDFK